MKKLIGLIGIIALAGTLAQAATETKTLVTTNGETAYVTFTQAQGILDKIEYVKTGLSTGTLTVATFDGTTAIETYFTKSIVGTTRGFNRTMVIGSTSAGSALAGVIAGGDSSNVTTVLVAPYVQPVIGGNVKAKFVNDQEPTSTNVITIFYTPIGK